MLAGSLRFISLPITVLLFTSLQVAEEPSTGLLRTPTISATQIAFAYANNI